MIAKQQKNIYGEFIDFIVEEEMKNNSFSIGRSDELKKLNIKIQTKFPIIIKLLYEKIVRKDAHNTIELKDYISSWFGYDKFITVTFFDLLGKIACEKSGKTQYCDIVQTKIVEMLCDAFLMIKKRLNKYPKQS
ncbi:hypothetical protein [Anaerotignum propionicum]|uniref:hypothetical protein n=1 Tax=Anaerotignum propionicum TaxID=28446 RepID=UPI00210B3D0C|nr:hypothetical protein [Anaerotignum propionicum]MCQ4936341.1 hypothetical protein [Anaerotignum propionicum]